MVHPAAWIDLLARPQSTPDRNTRGYLDGRGRRHWLDVFADVPGAPARVNARR